MGRENITANAGGSQGGKSDRRMSTVVSCVPAGVACMALRRRVRSMMAAYLAGSRWVMVIGVGEQQCTYEGDERAT